MLIEANDPRTVGVMGLLQHLNNQELKDLLNEDTRFEFIIKDSQVVKQQESEKDMLLASNKSLAEYNLSFEPKLTVGKQKLVELYQLASQLEKSLEEKERLMEEKGGDVTLETAIVLLQTAATQAEEESENLAEKFMDHTLDVETFIEEFQLKRKTAHLRKVKTDKIKELAAKKQQQQMAASPIMRPAPPPPTYLNQHAMPNSNPLTNPMSSFPPNNLPYPIFPPNQPSSGLPYPVYPNAMYPRY